MANRRTMGALQKRRVWTTRRESAARRPGYASSGFLDGGNPTAWWAREFGDQFDGIMQITAKPFHHGKSRAFDPSSEVHD